MKTYDQRVTVVFDRSMLASRDVILAWAQHFRESTGVGSEKLVSMDNYYSHLLPEFQKKMREGNSLIDEIPPNTSDLIQTNDRGLGKQWKDIVSKKIEGI